MVARKCKDSEVKSGECLILKIQLLGKELVELAKELENLNRLETLKIHSENVLEKRNVLDKKNISSQQDDRIDRHLRLYEVLQIYPISKSTFWAGIKTGRYPAPNYALGPKIPTWKQSTIMQLINGDDHHD